MEQALAAIDETPPEVVLLDLGLPGISGLEGIPRLLERLPRLSIMVLTVYDDDDRIFEALCSGACGYLLKNTPPARLLSSIVDAAAGRAPLSPEVARRLVALFDRPTPARAGARALSRDERRLLDLLVQGHNDPTAAETMGVDVESVARLSRSILDKLATHSLSGEFAGSSLEHKEP
jgi:DNA-binding NarL/FixJ family response regulator